MTAPMRRRLIVLVSLLLAGVGRADAQLPTVQHEGYAYVELERVAANLNTRLDATPGSVRAYLRTPGHVITFTRNWAHVVVDGTPMILEAPVRVKAGVWLVPQTFVTRAIPSLVVKSTAGSPPGALVKVAARTATLDELRLRSYPSFTRLVLETTDTVAYRIESTGPREARVRITGLGVEPRVEEVRDGFVASVKLERAGADALVRVVFEGAAGELKASALADPPRLVLDFRRPGQEAERGSVQATPLRLIVLDAGHGGDDPGALGPTGLQEKELVLDVTRRVARLIEDRLGIKVLLSRDGDHFVPLRDRTSFANRNRADLFVSIHANAHRQTGSAGVETFFLSSEATDNEARQVAAQENSVADMETSTSRVRADFVKAILWDLAQSEFQMESSRLAEIVQDSMTQALRIPNRGVKQAGFYVLGGAAMPAVLIEVGFVTNPREEKRLREGKYRDEIARAILAGLAEYKRYWDQRMRSAAERPR
jgi:N-acetylmuramoyl-L-alanine amidase